MYLFISVQLYDDEEHSKQTVLEHADATIRKAPPPFIVSYQG